MFRWRSKTKRNARGESIRAELPTRFPLTQILAADDEFVRFMKNPWIAVRRSSGTHHQCTFRQHSSKPFHFMPGKALRGKHRWGVTQRFQVGVLQLHTLFTNVLKRIRFGEQQKPQVRKRAMQCRVIPFQQRGNDVFGTRGACKR